ncbi:MAG TPA: hypothetical protein VF077_09620 [Nitrospiraceae bacterium]
MSGLVPYARTYTYPTFSSLAPYRPDPIVPPSPTAPQSLKDWWRELRGPEQPSSAVDSAVLGLRHNAEGAVVGALLAFIDTDLGGLDLGGRIPLDWVGAAAFYALSVRDSNNPQGLSSDFRAMGQSCTTIAMYRTIHKWRESLKDMPQNKTVGVTGDPVLKAGKQSF